MSTSAPAGGSGGGGGGGSGKAKFSWAAPPETVKKPKHRHQSGINSWLYMNESGKVSLYTKLRSVEEATAMKDEFNAAYEKLPAHGSMIYKMEDTPERKDMGTVYGGRLSALMVPAAASLASSDRY